jgi:hypothetical protein
MQQFVCHECRRLNADASIPKPDATIRSFTKNSDKAMAYEATTLTSTIKPESTVGAKNRSNPMWKGVEVRSSANRRSPEKSNMLGSRRSLIKPRPGL